MKHFKGNLVYLSKEELAELKSYTFPVYGTFEMAEAFCSKANMLINLRTLTLLGSRWRHNKYGRLFISKISVLSTLEFFDCSFCGLRKLDSLCHLKNLKILNCCGNKLKALPSDLCLQNLEEFYCSNCDLKELPSLCHLKNLKILNCCRNYDLTFLPFDLGFLQALEELNCYHCDLQELPSLCYLKNLKILDCSLNGLKSLPSDIGLLQNLKEFDCSHNQLSSLPFSLGNLSNLKRFYCHNNNLSSLPFSICHLSPNLNIRYSDNPLLPEIPQDCWTNLLIYLKEKAVEEF